MHPTARNPSYGITILIDIFYKDIFYSTTNSSILLYSSMLYREISSVVNFSFRETSAEASEARADTEALICCGRGGAAPNRLQHYNNNSIKSTNCVPSRVATSFECLNRQRPRLPTLQSLRRSP
jgi:hypothetical protein